MQVFVLKTFWTFTKQFLLSFPPTQLPPNSFRNIISFFVLCHMLETQPRISLFQALFSLKRHPIVKDWQFIDSYQGCTFITSLLSAIHSQKSIFFFISFDVRWKINWVSSELNTRLNKNDKVLTTNNEDFNRLLNMEITQQQDLLLERSLYDTKLSPINSLNKSLKFIFFIYLLLFLLSLLLDLLRI